jgi:hypothetical protein
VRSRDVVMMVSARCSPTGIGEFGIEFGDHMSEAFGGAVNSAFSGVPLAYNR